LPGQRDADLVIMPVRVFTLSPIPAQGVSGGKALFYAHFKHAASVSFLLHLYCNARKSYFLAGVFLPSLLTSLLLSLFDSVLASPPSVWAAESPPAPSFSGPLADEEAGFLA